MAVKSGRGLKLFGVAGGALLGAGLLYAYLQTDAGKGALDRFPTDEEGKKTWWKEMISKAGIGITE